MTDPRKAFEKDITGTLENASETTRDTRPQDTKKQKELKHEDRIKDAGKKNTHKKDETPKKVNGKNIFTRIKEEASKTTPIQENRQKATEQPSSSTA